jgi:pre-mRNA-splicing helicase BRR2
MQGKTSVHLSEYLSDLVDRTLLDLEKSGCISNNEGALNSINFGKIAVYYNVKYNSVGLFAQSLSDGNKIMNLIDIICSAYEFDDIPIRHGEDELLRSLANDINFKKGETLDFSDPHVKSNILLQIYLNRIPCHIDLLSDQKQVIEFSHKLVLAMVDVISNNQWLKTTLLAMELSQMIVQAMWIEECSLLQLPQFDEQLINECKKQQIESISDLMGMEDEDRKKLLRGLNDRQLDEVATVCNRYALFLNLDTLL